MDSEKTLSECVCWLLDFLSGGAKPRRIVSGEAIKAGFTKSQLKSARKVLRVKLIQSDGEFIQEDFWMLRGV